MDTASEREFADWAIARGPRLHRLAYVLTDDWQAAEDLVQEALARTALHWKRVRAADHPDAYVRRIVINEAKQRWRRHRGSETLLPDPGDIAVADGSSGRAERQELIAAVRQLPRAQRAVIALRYLDGLSESETAAALGCSNGTVKSHTHRALASLRQVLAVEGSSHVDR